MQLIDGIGPIWQGGLWLPREFRPTPPPNQPPVAGADTATVVAVGSVEIDALANDTDPEGGALSITGAEASFGSVAIGAGGVLTYTPNLGFIGVDTITYTLADPEGLTDTGTVTVTVTAPNQPPVAGADTATVVAGGSVEIDALANDTDPEGGALSITGAQASFGSVAIGADGLLTYTPNAGFAGVDTITYTLADPEGLTDTGTVTVTVTAPLLSIDESPTDGTFSVNAETGELEITITAPAGYQGTYHLNIAELANGPVNLVAPVVDGDARSGATLTARAGLWVYDEAFAPLEIARQWYRASAAVDGATEATYVVTASDLPEGMSLIETATDAAGTRQVQVTAFEPVEDTFTETGVVFDGSAYLQRNADLATDSLAVLYFASLIFTGADNRQGILRQRSVRNGIDLYGYKFRLHVDYTDGSEGNWSSERSIPIGQRVHALVSVRPNGDGSVSRPIYVWLPGDPDWQLESIGSPALKPIDLTTGSFVIGADNPAYKQFLAGTVYRIACWAGQTVADITDPAVRAAFVTAGGSGLVDPSVSHSLFGQPRVDLYGPAADYAAGVNHGTSGSFDSYTGTFKDA